MICIPAQAGDWQQAHEPEPRPSLAVRTGQPHQATPRTHFPDESGWHGQELSCRKIQIVGFVPVSHPGTPGHGDTSTKAIAITRERPQLAVRILVS